VHFHVLLRETFCTRQTVGLRAKCFFLISLSRPFSPGRDDWPYLLLAAALQRQSNRVVESRSVKEEYARAKQRYKRKVRSAFILSLTRGSCTKKWARLGSDVGLEG